MYLSHWTCLESSVILLNPSPIWDEGQTHLMLAATTWTSPDLRNFCDEQPFEGPR